MGYLDRAKALMEDADLEVKTGIDCVKSVVSAKTLPETKPLTERYRFKYPDDLPDHPTQPCPICGDIELTYNDDMTEMKCSQGHKFPAPESK